MGCIKLCNACKLYSCHFSRWLFLEDPIVVTKTLAAQANQFNCWKTQQGYPAVPLSQLWGFGVLNLTSTWFTLENSEKKEMMMTQLRTRSLNSYQKLSGLGISQEWERQHITYFYFHNSMYFTFIWALIYLLWELFWDLRFLSWLLYWCWYRKYG